MEDEPVDVHTCWHCDTTSHNPHDNVNRYCRSCRHFCDDADTAALLVELSKKYGRGNQT